MLKIKQDGNTKDITWTQGTAADPVLTNITVFDGRCARVITDDRNEISYLPSNWFETVSEWRWHRGVEKAGTEFFRGLLSAKSCCRAAY